MWLVEDLYLYLYFSVWLVEDPYLYLYLYFSVWLVEDLYLYFSVWLVGDLLLGGELASGSAEAPSCAPILTGSKNRENVIFTD